MAYTIQALVGSAPQVRALAPEGAVIIDLPQGKAMIPLSAGIRQRYSIPFLPLTDEGSEDIPESISTIVSKNEKIAYIEAELFGGDGAQASAIWDGGELIFGPIIANDAINQALHLLGVVRAGPSDEFDELDLGRHRNTDDWK